jgi:hypothetical protein
MWLYTGYGLENGFIDHLYTPLGTTSNYSATANFHNSQTTTAPAKPFPACCVFTTRSLATASNSGDSSASRAQVLCHSHSYRSQLNCQSLPSLPCRTQLNWLESESESESELLYDWRFTAKQFVLATSPLRFTTRIFIFQLNTCGYSPYVTSSMTRG